MPPVYAAQYSKVPVWVLNVNDVNVMRRQGDGWVNATHLLRVADFDKPKRTRILERDVQVGEHEKVQGGYGKYQGTWIPVGRAFELSEQVGILDLVNDLLVYEPKEGVEPLELPKLPRQPSVKRLESQNAAKRARKINSAPTHTQIPNSSQSSSAGSTRINQGMLAPPIPLGPPAQSLHSMPNQSYPVNWQYSQQAQQAHAAQAQAAQAQAAQAAQAAAQAAQAAHPQMNPQFNPNYTYNYQKAPIPNYGNMKDMYGYEPERKMYRPAYSQSSDSDQLSDDDMRSGRQYTSNSFVNGFQPARQATIRDEERSQPVTGSLINGQNGPSQYMAEYSSRLLDYFMSPDKSVVPPFLLHPTAGPHINDPIDDEGNTVFHWTCSIGQTDILRALLRAGADVQALNSAGQTPLVRSILFTNNHETRTFPQVLESLVSTVGYIDSSGRTVLHHIASTTSSKSRGSGARYYTEILLARLSASPQLLQTELGAFLNLQDSNGDTALHIASANKSRAVCRVLLVYGASASIPNKLGVTAEETLRKYAGTEDVQFEDEPFQNTYSGMLGVKTNQAVGQLLAETARLYDVDIENKDADIEQVRKLLESTKQKVSDAQNAIPDMLHELGSEEEALKEAEQQQQLLAQKQAELQQLIERSQARTLALEVQKEEQAVHKELDAQLQSGVDDLQQQQKLELILNDLQVHRRALVDEIVVLYSNTGAENKIEKYRKLLSICCEIDEKEVDGLLDGIASVLKTQDVR